MSAETDQPQEHPQNKMERRTFLSQGLAGSMALLGTISGHLRLQASDKVSNEQRNRILSVLHSDTCPFFHLPWKDADGKYHREDIQRHTKNMQSLAPALAGQFTGMNPLQSHVAVQWERENLKGDGPRGETLRFSLYNHKNPLRAKASFLYDTKEKDVTDIRHDVPLPTMINIRQQRECLLRALGVDDAITRLLPQEGGHNFGFRESRDGKTFTLIDAQTEGFNQELGTVEVDPKTGKILATKKTPLLDKIISDFQKNIHE